LAMCAAKPCTEGFALPVARRPCGHERQRNAHKDTPKKIKTQFSKMTQTKNRRAINFGTFSKKEFVSLGFYPVVEIVCTIHYEPH
ncbi:MAG: hypothetical protein RML94_15935, partial [Bacteroidia bacterium]|nr:hypothetical protein [Bacteroidia bacterium]